MVLSLDPGSYPSDGSTKGPAVSWALQPERELEATPQPSRVGSTTTLRALAFLCPPRGAGGLFTFPATCLSHVPLAPPRRNMQVPLALTLESWWERGEREIGMCPFLYG